jgi:hypothetical protein
MEMMSPSSSSHDSTSPSSPCWSRPSNSLEMSTRRTEAWVYRRAPSTAASRSRCTVPERSRRVTGESSSRNSSRKSGKDSHK